MLRERAEQNRRQEQMRTPPPAAPAPPSPASVVLAEHLRLLIGRVEAAGCWHLLPAAEALLGMAKIAAVLECLTPEPNPHQKQVAASKLRDHWQNTRQALGRAVETLASELDGAAPRRSVRPRGRLVTVSERTRQQICRHKAAGVSVVEIARLFGLSRPTVYAVLKAAPPSGA
jgi:hypothetical protein